MSGQGGAGEADKGVVAVGGGDFDDSNAITGFHVTDTKAGISETMELCWVVKNFEEVIKKSDFKAGMKSPTFEGPLSKDKWLLSFNRPKAAGGKIMVLSLQLKETPALCVEVKFGSRLILSPEDEEKYYECEHLNGGLTSVTFAEESAWCWMYPWPAGFPDDTFKLKFKITVNFVEPKGPVGVVFTPEVAEKFKAKLRARNNAIDAAKKNQK